MHSKTTRRNRRPDDSAEASGLRDRFVSYGVGALSRWHGKMSDGSPMVANSVNCPGAVDPRALDSKHVDGRSFQASNLLAGNWCWSQRPQSVRCEWLAEDSASEAWRIFDVLGPEWDERVARYADHSGRRRRTDRSGYHQVVQPIYGHAKYRWWRYEKHPAPQRRTCSHPSSGGRDTEGRGASSAGEAVRSQCVSSQPNRRCTWE